MKNEVVVEEKGMELKVVRTNRNRKKFSHELWKVGKKHPKVSTQGQNCMKKGKKGESALDQENGRQCASSLARWRDKSAQERLELPYVQPGA